MGEITLRIKKEARKLIVERIRDCAQFCLNEDMIFPVN